MKAPEHATPSHQRLVVQTQGEITRWMDEVVVGATPRAESYLRHMRSLAQNAVETGDDQLRGYVAVLGVQIADATEERLAHTAAQHGGTLPSVVPGVTPVREVIDEDIDKAAAKFDPTQLEYRDYVDSLKIIIQYKHHNYNIAVVPI